MADTISRSLDILAGLSARAPDFWKRLGRLESLLLAGELPAIKAPVYICGLARSGSTLLLEILASHSQVATHRYRDFPFLLTPYVWNMSVSLMPMRSSELRERAHADGMQITPESPEAMEEMLWMAFFPHLHDGRKPQVFTHEDAYPAFENFYRQHIQKLLLIRHATRYVAKGNYNITRMAYLKKLFPDARFVIPLRDPVSHVASLMRQHRHFSELSAQDPRVQKHMSLAGHFEFGPGRRAIHTGDETALRHIHSAWNDGREAVGWALYWNMIHRFLYDQLHSPDLSGCTLAMKLEAMSSQPPVSIAQMLEHCQLPTEDAVIQRFAPMMHATDNRHGLSDNEVATIRDITAKTASLFGYHS